MRAVFGIDVSKASSEVAILVNGEKVHGYTMSNDALYSTKIKIKPIKCFLTIVY